jgi:hypothetical protein
MKHSATLVAIALLLRALPTEPAYSVSNSINRSPQAKRSLLAVFGDVIAERLSGQWIGPGEFKHPLGPYAFTEIGLGRVGQTTTFQSVADPFDEAPRPRMMLVADKGVTAYSGPTPAVPRKVTVRKATQAETDACASYLKKTGGISIRPSMKNTIIVDLDGDGTSETILHSERTSGSSGIHSLLLLVYRANGRLAYKSLEFNVGSNAIYSVTPEAIVDFDKDGRMEVITGAKDVDSGRRAKIWEFGSGGPKKVFEADWSPC